MTNNWKVTFLKRFGNNIVQKDIILLLLHQLSAPLESIQWSLRMILDGDFGKITEEQREVLEKACKKNGYLIRLADSFMDTNVEICDLPDIVNDAYDSCSDDIKKKKISFEIIKLSPKFPKIAVDREKITLAVQNLLDNAIKYTPPGGKITIFLKALRKNVEFIIQDSGIGMEKKQKAKIFNKFFRGKNAGREDPIGHGLGLFFVKNIIKAHKGKIWFESRENQGSAFYFTLPIKKKLRNIL